MVSKGIRRDLIQGCVNRKRRSKRTARTSFISLIVPFASPKHDYQRDLTTRTRSHNRRKRTVFGKLIFTNTGLEEKYELKRMKNTAHKKKSRLTNNNEQCEKVRALDNARKKRKRQAQTTEEKNRVRLLNLASQRRARRKMSTDQQSILKPLDTNQKVGSRTQALTKKVTKNATRNTSQRRQNKRTSISTSVSDVPHENINLEEHKKKSEGTNARRKSFFEACRQFKWICCSKCNVSFTKVKDTDICTICLKDMKNGVFPLKFSADNYMDPGIVPNVLKRLTELEHILIAKIHPMMSVYRIKGQQYKYSGNVINFAQDVNSIATVLPYKPSDLSALLI